MNYYIFKPATNTFETGYIYPQVQKMSPGYNYNAPNSVHALSKAYKDIPDYMPNLDYFEVNSKAKLSDLLSVAVVDGGFLICEKLKNIFEQFNLPTHQFYFTKVHYKKQFYNYYWIHIICNLTDIVDYTKSTFFIYYNYAHNLGYVNISSKNDMIQKRKKIKEENPGKTITIWAKKIVLNKAFDKNLDLFQIGDFDSAYYISERLYNTIINAKTTGVEMQFTEKLFFL